MTGQTISHFKILEKLGQGGMGVVYKAEDTKLDRLVALKFLPPHLQAGEQEKARFVQEAKAAAALNHPNICSVLDIDQANDQMFIVMEFVDGQTLREKKGTLSFKQAIDIGIQIADGLSVAHEKGIVHRDIKPENVMIRKDGIAQIMDFGLAKLRGTVSRLTKEGSTVGTAGYMSPEQVQGQDADHRSDIFSYGVLLYELLTGQLPFKGVHETAIAYEIVNVDPAPMSAVNPEIDPHLDAIVLECLEKDPSERTQSAKQISVDLKRYRRESSRQRVSRVTAARPAYTLSAARPPEGVRKAPQPATSRLARLLPWVISAVFCVLLAAVAFVHFRESPAETASINAAVLPPERWNFVNENDGGHLALSPDGTLLAFVASDSSGKSFVWLRPLGSSSARQLPETEGASYPFWSSDNKFIGFFASSKLKKIPVAGGPAFTICDAPNGRGGTWNEAGVILFSPRFDQTGLYRVSAAGGEALQVTSVDSGLNQTNHRWPHFLPDGNHFIYTTQPRTRTTEFYGAIYVGSLDSSVNKLLLKVPSNAVYAGGNLLYVRQGTVVAQPLSLSNFEFSGDAVPIAEKVEYSSDKSRGMFTVSSNGILVFQPSSNQLRRLSWFDRSGRKLEDVGDKSVATWGKLSRDTSRIAFDSFDPEAKTNDIWLYDLERKVNTRFTFERADEYSPIWSSDGSRVVFSSDKSGQVDLYIKNANGTETEQLLAKMDGHTTVIADDWSPDGKYILYQVFVTRTYWDLWVLPMEGERKPALFLQSEFEEQFGQFSPDMRWVAYQSDESGKPEIYVRPFPTGSGKWQVSSGGGTTPLWRRDGKELFYSLADGTVMSADVNGTGSTFLVGSVRKVFASPVGAAARIYDVTANGQRFLVGTLSADQVVPPLTLVTNWDKELRKK